MAKAQKKAKLTKYITRHGRGWQYCQRFRDSKGVMQTITKQARTEIEAILKRDETQNLIAAIGVDAYFSGKRTMNGAMTVREAVEKWMREDIPTRHLSESTLKSYNHQIARFLPYVGNMTIDKIDKQLFKAAFIANGGQRHAKEAYARFYDCFLYLVGQDVIKDVPILPPRSVRFNMPPKQRRRAFTREEEAAFLAAARRMGDKWYYIFRLYFESTMRRGELCALRWDDVDFDRQAIHVQHNIIVTRDGEKLGAPKTRKSIRWIPISDTIRNYLKPLYDARKNDEDFVFVNGTRVTKYQWLSTRVIDMRFAAIRADAGIDPTLTMHCTRHTTASRLADMDVPLPVIMEIGGWTSKTVPMDIYIHVSHDKT